MLSSACLQYKDYYSTPYRLACPTSKNHTGVSLAHMKTTIACLLFCHEKHSLNNIQRCLLYELLHRLTEKRNRLFETKHLVKKWCQNISVLIYGLIKKWPNDPSCIYSSPHTQTLMSCVLTRNFCRQIPIILRVHVSTEMKLSFIAKQN
jgi:hypothetical protein